jgi:hypothetical protein
VSATLDDSPDQHLWTFSEHRITQLCIDPTACRLQTWSLNASLEIRIGVPFQLTLADGSSRDIDPEAHEQVAPMLTLMSRELLQLTVTRGGSLDVRFSDGSTVSVESHPRYEAFEVIGAGSLEGMQYRASRVGGSPWRNL